MTKLLLTISLLITVFVPVSAPAPSTAPPLTFSPVLVPSPITEINSDFTIESNANSALKTIHLENFSFDYPADWEIKPATNKMFEDYFKYDFIDTKNNNRNLVSLSCPPPPVGYEFITRDESIHRTFIKNGKKVSVDRSHFFENENYWNTFITMAFEYDDSVYSFTSDRTNCLLSFGYGDKIEDVDTKTIDQIYLSIR